MVVGPKKIEYLIHRALLEHFSCLVDRALNGSWKESDEGCIRIENFDEETVTRFIQFIYNGNYNLDQATRYREFFTLAFQERTRLGEWGNKWDNFDMMKFVHSHDLPEVSQKSIETGDESVYMPHVKLYVFAEMYQVKQLSVLCLEKLWSILHSKKHRDLNISELVEFIDYVYNNTSDRPGQAERMRKLVSTFAACLISMLGKMPPFQALLGRQPDLGKDMIVELSNDARYLQDSQW